MRRPHRGSERGDDDGKREQPVPQADVRRTVRHEDAARAAAGAAVGSPRDGTTTGSARVTEERREIHDGGTRRQTRSPSPALLGGRLPLPPPLAVDECGAGALVSSVVEPGERVAGLAPSEHDADEDLAVEVERPPKACIRILFASGAVHVGDERAVRHERDRRFADPRPNHSPTFRTTGPNIASKSFLARESR